MVLLWWVTNASSSSAKSNEGIASVGCFWVPRTVLVAQVNALERCKAVRARRTLKSSFLWLKLSL